MRWPLRLGRRSEAPTFEAGESDHAPTQFAAEQWDEPPTSAALQSLPRAIGPAPLTMRPDQFISGLAVSHGLTPTLRRLDRGDGSGGPAGLIGGLAVPLAPPAGCRATRAGERPMDRAARAPAGDRAPAPAGPGGWAEDAGTGTGRRLPAVASSVAEMRRSYTSVDPASDLGWSAGGARPTDGEGHEASSPAPAAVHRPPGSQFDSADSAGGRLAGSATPSDAGSASLWATASLSVGRIRRAGLGEPLATLPGSALPGGLAQSQPSPRIGSEATRGSASAGAATETMRLRRPVSGGASRSLSALSVLPRSHEDGTTAEPGPGSGVALERQTTTPRSDGPSWGSSGGARRASSAAGPAPTRAGGTGSTPVQRSAIGRPPAAYAHVSAHSGSSTAGSPSPTQTGAAWSAGYGAAGARGHELGDAGQPELRLAGPSGSSTSWPGYAGGADAGVAPVIQRIHLAQPTGPVMPAGAAPMTLPGSPDLVGSGDGVVARAAAAGASGGAVGAGAASSGAAAGAQSMPDDQVEQLARRVYSRVRERLGAELLRERERAGLLHDR